MIHLDLKFQTSWAKQDKEGAKEGGARERLSDDLSSEPSDTDMYPPLDTNTKISIPRPVLLTERLVLWKITLMINGRKATLLPFTFIDCSWLCLLFFYFIFKICFLYLCTVTMGLTALRNDVNYHIKKNVISGWIHGQRDYYLKPVSPR